MDNYLFNFGIESLTTLAKNHSDDYKNATPFPHIVLDDFLPSSVAQAAMKHFPSPDSEIWLDWKKRDVVNQPKKLGIGHASRLTDVSPWLLHLLNTFNSYPFLMFLQKLTGINKLLPDPYFHGGGLHQIMNGGKLSIHTDFNDLKPLNLYRRINVLFYLNENWKEEYNGHLELWDKECGHCVHSIAPILNRMVIFNTDKHSFHGHPKPLNTSEQITRKSIALYY